MRRLALVLAIVSLGGGQSQLERHPMLRPQRFIPPRPPAPSSMGIARQSTDKQSVPMEAGPSPTAGLPFNGPMVRHRHCPHLGPQPRSVTDDARRSPSPLSLRRLDLRVAPWSRTACGVPRQGQALRIHGESITGDPTWDGVLPE